MSGQSAPDDTARLEAALDRIARASARAAASARRAAAAAALPDGEPHATSAAPAADTAEVAMRLDTLIADLRAVLGGHG